MCAKVRLLSVMCNFFTLFLLCERDLVPQADGGEGRETNWGNDSNAALSQMPLAHRRDAENTETDFISVRGAAALGKLSQFVSVNSQWAQIIYEKFTSN